MSEPEPEKAKLAPPDLPVSTASSVVTATRALPTSTAVPILTADYDRQARSASVVVPASAFAPGGTIVPVAAPDNLAGQPRPYAPSYQPRSAAVAAGPVSAPSLTERRAAILKGGGPSTTPGRQPDNRPDSKPIAPAFGPIPLEDRPVAADVVVADNVPIAAVPARRDATAVSEIFQTPAAAAEPQRQRKPWYPPKHAWHVYVLSILTLVYPLVWTYRFAEDIRRHRRRRVRPWLYVVAWIGSLGLAMPYVVYRQARWIHRLHSENDRTTWPTAKMVGIGAALILAAAISVGLASVAGALPGLAIFALIVLLWLVYPLPWVVMQRQLNIYKASRPVGLWTSKPYRLGIHHYLAMIVGFCLVGAIGYSAYLNTSPRLAGQQIAAETHVMGRSGRYTVTAPGDNWVRARQGTLADNADLELIGKNLETQVVGRALTGDRWTLDSLGVARREAIAAGGELISAEEERTLLPNTINPVSYARYVVRRGDATIVFSVVTVITEGEAFEIVGFTPEAGGSAPQIETLVRSFELL